MRQAQKRPAVANLPAVDDLRETLSSLSRTVAFAPGDWTERRADAWVYGILVGWDDDEDALQELAEQHGWSEEQVARLRRYRAAIVNARDA